MNKIFSFLFVWFLCWFLTEWFYRRKTFLNNCGTVVSDKATNGNKEARATVSEHAANRRPRSIETMCNDFSRFFGHVLTVKLSSLLKKNVCMRVKTLPRFQAIIFWTFEFILRWPLGVIIAGSKRRIFSRFSNKLLFEFDYDCQKIGRLDTLNKAVALWNFWEKCCLFCCIVLSCNRLNAAFWLVVTLIHTEVVVTNQISRFYLARQFAILPPPYFDVIHMQKLNINKC
jgi:hypothetical protein